MKFGFSKIVSILGVAAVSSLSISADAPAGYYNALEGKTGSDLQRAVKSIVTWTSPSSTATTKSCGG